MALVLERRNSIYCLRSNGKELVLDQLLEEKLIKNVT